jgi:hypothetical protein
MEIDGMVITNSGEILNAEGVSIVNLDSMAQKAQATEQRKREEAKIGKNINRRNERIKNDDAFGQAMYNTEPTGKFLHTYCVPYEIPGQQDDFLFFRKEKKLANGDILTLNVNVLDVHNAAFAPFKNGEPYQPQATPEVIAFDKEHYEPIYQRYMKLFKEVSENKVSDEALTFLWPDGTLWDLYPAVFANLNPHTTVIMFASDKLHNGNVKAKVLKFVVDDSSGVPEETLSIVNHDGIEKQMFEQFQMILNGHPDTKTMQEPMFYRLRAFIDEQRKPKATQADLKKSEEDNVARIRAAMQRVVDTPIIEPVEQKDDSSFEELAW